MPADPPLITLTTDFGLTDEYVGVLKGVIAGLAPQARIIDLCHNVPPQDVRHAACLLQASWPYFPPSALHLVVVDPGVGTGRRIILLDTDHGRFLAPDNGVLTPLLDRPGRQHVHAVTNQKFFLHPRSTTFHGRDLFAPVAAALANGAAPADLGPPLDPTALTRLTLPQPHLDTATGSAMGAVVAIDHFGNLITNLAATDLATLNVPTGRFMVQVDGVAVGVIHDTYAAVGANEVVALIGSRGTLEIAVNQGNAALRLQASIGSRVLLAPVSG